MCVCPLRVRPTGGIGGCNPSGPNPLTCLPPSSMPSATTRWGRRGSKTQPRGGAGHAPWWEATEGMSPPEGLQTPNRGSKTPFCPWGCAALLYQYHRRICTHTHTHTH
ncbi:MAG: hypothetical protein ACK55Z_09260, partial [bacterium]